MRAEDIIKSKLELMELTLWSSFKNLTTRQLNVFGQQYFNGFGEVRADPERFTTLASVMADSMYLAMADGLREAMTFRVTREMSQLVDFAANDLDETTRLDTTLAPSEAGLVYFESPIIVHDVFGREMKIRWMQWVPLIAGWEPDEWASAYGGDDPDYAPNMDEISRAKNVYFFMDPAEPSQINDFMVENRPTNMAMRRRIFGQFQLVGAEMYRPWHEVGPSMTYDDGARPMSFIDPQTGELTAEPTTDRRDGMSLPYENMNRIIHALWSLMHQKVATVTDEPVRKHFRQQAQQKNATSAVNVIALRNREQAPPTRKQGESAVAWSKRWPVRAHWAWRWYGPRDGEQVRRQVWIETYLKGNPDAPLDIRPRVYDVRPDPQRSKA